MRQESAGELWHGDPNAPLESWTSYPKAGLTRRPLMRWIRDQLERTTHMQLSGSVCPLSNFIELGDWKPSKQGLMSIEMAIAANRTTTTSRSSARREDTHLLALIAVGRNPSPITNWSN